MFILVRLDLGLWENLSGKKLPAFNLVRLDFGWSEKVRREKVAIVYFGKVMLAKD